MICMHAKGLGLLLDFMLGIVANKYKSCQGCCSGLLSAAAGEP